MDSELFKFSSTFTILITSFFALLLLHFLLSWRSSSKTKSNISLSRKQAPEAAGSWPFLGHLHVLASGPDLPHINLAVLADKYGPAFTIRIGQNPALVVSSWEIAKECFTTNDKLFASHPKQKAMQHLGYDYAMFGFSPYGPYWRELRKIMNQEVLSHTRLESLQHIWDSEIKTSLRELYESLISKNNEKSSSNGEVVVDMKKWFADLVLNITVKMVVGKRLFGSDNNHDYNQVAITKLKGLFKLLGTFVLGDAIPSLGFLDFGGHEKEMKSTAKELDSLMEEWLQEHKRKRLLSGEMKKGEEQDFMDVMLTILDGDTKLTEFYDADTINKATCLGLITGAGDTTAAIGVWVLSLLVNNQDKLKKVHDELDIHVGRDRQVEESDMKNLTYIQAVLKEAFRLHGAVPLSGFRVAAEDCTLGGYHVPAGTRLIINAWKIHNDPRIWTDPSEFKPERFLTTHKDIDVRGHNPQLIPFGMGRRGCPGVPMALQVLHLALARTIHGFEFKTLSGRPTDMTGTAGLTNMKATPLEVLLTPRLPPKFYV
uniref:Putative cytochrome P450 n=1 Tax=Eschscholzia californica subsp. californica TaxID=222997 RepID=A0A2Z6BXT6_ESCCA|nr:putative cytochrome P450 [Eschscholzia californica subsp. californica]